MCLSALSTVLGAMIGETVLQKPYIVFSRVSEAKTEARVILNGRIKTLQAHSGQPYGKLPGPKLLIKPWRRYDAMIFFLSSLLVRQMRATSFRIPDKSPLVDQPDKSIARILLVLYPRALS